MTYGFLVVVGDAMVAAWGLWVGWAVGFMGFGGSWWAWDGLWVGVFGWLNQCWYGDWVAGLEVVW